MTNRLFVYGTLAPGRSNEHVLADLPGDWRPASVRGTLFQRGWGAAAGYPGIILDDRGDNVAGLLFTCPELAGQWQRLDDFEGAGYRRVMTWVTLADGQQVTAYVYELVNRSRATLN